MAETANIARMADIVSNEIFRIFKWETVGPKNENWNCVKPEKHKVTTHSTDVVFHYKNAYVNSVTYVLAELKSYSKESITPTMLEKAIVKLDKTLDCAKVSRHWKELYQSSSTPYCVGLLFVYNHDGEYDANFPTILKNAVSKKKIEVAKDNILYILEPKDISCLNTVAGDITKERVPDGLIKSNKYGFYYYHKNRKPVLHNIYELPACLKMLKSPWIIVQYATDASEKEHGLIIYMKSSGETIEEFLYLIDYLVYTQEITNASKLTIKTVYPGPNAAATFDRARLTYIDEYGNSEFSDKVKKIDYKCIRDLSIKMYNVEIGMDHG